MIVARVKVQCLSDKTEEMLQAMRAVVGPSRALPGVIHFDVARDVIDANALIALEVFEDRAALTRQNAQPEVAAVIKLIEAGALTQAPEWTVYEVIR
jgi:quinol monooxygenase YgiN